MILSKNINILKVEVKCNNMKKMIYLLIFSILFFGCASKPKIKKLDNPNYLNHFYKVQNDSGKIFYILGTIHISSYSIDELPDSIEQAFIKSDLVYVESKINYDEVQNMQKYLYENSISSINSGECLNIFKNITKQYSSINEEMKVYNAMMINSLATNEVNGELGLSGDLSIDVYISNRIDTDNKAYFELESIEEQYQIIAELSKAAPTYLLKYVEDKEMLKDSIKKIYLSYSEDDLYNNSYNDSDTEIIDFDSKEIEEEFEQYSKILGTNRNDDMISTILNSNSKDTNFIAVGAGHLYGEDGLLSQFEKNGYTITRITE